MPLVRATHSGAKTILAHFHYCCKGQQPFHPDFDWATPQIRKMAQLDSEQIMFMEKIKERVNQNGDYQASSNITTSECALTVNSVAFASH
jgi:hypothetical protein